MIIVIDALNRIASLISSRKCTGSGHVSSVTGSDGTSRSPTEMEMDIFDSLDPAYVVSLDQDGHVVGCMRLLQTTGPHMLADVFADILEGEPPLRSSADLGSDKVLR